jgi:hypothetical protein
VDLDFPDKQGKNREIGFVGFIKIHISKELGVGGIKITGEITGNGASP